MRSGEMPYLARLRPHLSLKDLQRGEKGMALKVVSMAELRLEVLLEAERTSETAADLQALRNHQADVVRVPARRYLADGLDGLEPRPHGEFSRTK